MGELKGVTIPTMGQLSAESETADLWQPKWNENQAVLAAAIHMLGRNSGVSWKGQRLGAGVLELWSKPSVRAAVVCGERD